MSKLARDHRNAELAQIHIAVAEMGWSDDHYREVMRAVCYGVDSAAKLDSTGRQRLLAHFVKCGWKPKRQARPPQGWQAKKIEDLWEALGKVPGALTDPSRAGLLAFVQRQAGVAELRFLDTRKAIKVTEALKAWLKRVKAK